MKEKCADGVFHDAANRDLSQTSSLGDHARRVEDDTQIPGYDAGEVIVRPGNDAASPPPNARAPKKNPNKFRNPAPPNRPQKNEPAGERPHFPRADPKTNHCS